MEFNLSKSMEILERTPAVLETLLAGLSDEWVYNNEGSETWSPYDVVGHLVHGDKTDWLPRVNIILSATDKNFIPFNRFAQFEESKGKTLQQLLDDFKQIRKQSLDTLKALNITGDDLNKTGIHPEFGHVTLSQLLSTWTCHDLGHIVQIARTMARQYKDAAGPWVKYLSVLQ